MNAPQSERTDPQDQAPVSYRDSNSLTNWTRKLLFVQIGIGVLALISGGLEYQLLNAFENGSFSSTAEAVSAGEASDSRQRFVGLTQLVVYIVSGILILRWIHRANYNAAQLGARGMEFTPGWSIGWYFVPFANLWKPYEAMKEIWQASSKREDWKNQPVTALLGFWWFLWIVSNLLGNASFRLAMRADELSEFRTVNILNQLSDLTGVFLAPVLLVLIGHIHGMQMSLLADHQKTASFRPTTV